MDKPRGHAEMAGFYEARIKELDQQNQKDREIKNILAAARLMAFIATIGLAYVCWPASVPVFATVVIGSSILILLVVTDATRTDRIKNRERLVAANRHELAALDRNLSGYENGQAFLIRDHAFASDLDLFGPASLFEYVNRCHSDQAKKLLSERMLNPLPLETLSLVQDAAKELAKKTDWSQQFQSNVMASPLTFATQARLDQWINRKATHFTAAFWEPLVIVYSLISLSLLALYTFDLVSSAVFLPALILFIGIGFNMSSRIQGDWALLSRIEPEMNALYEQLSSLEKENFQSRFMQELQTKMRDREGLSAPAAINEFRGILKRFDFRLNLVVFVFLNTFLLWDLRQFLALQRWKKKHQSNLAGWFYVVFETEVTISLASLVSNEPDWHFPEIGSPYFHFSATNLGHPLIRPEVRINNSFGLDGTGKIALITGSNMAGKSTFLRALGANLVLAFMGAPVCASAFSASYVELLSSMRVADNLAENTSTFYAELKKLELIIQRVGEHRPVFILLDEVLRGTNSHDRHAGTIALIRQLIREKTVCVMATHDTRLAAEESALNPEAIINYHFDGQLHGDELSFDYRLQPGISRSMNAAYLMKKIGIRFDD
ncbi:MAG TPA: hypothetical protein VG890_16190 [Puia sp.]|nr:hypothetical protein [Puia sp.]